MKIAQKLTELIGNTPMLELKAYGGIHDLKAEIIAKLEFFNPAGSVKDRPAFYMIEEAERNGILAPGATIIEPTSGNMGVGLAFVSAVKGYKMILVMPETMSLERRNLARALSAQVVLSPGSEGMAGSLKMAEKLHAELPGSVLLGQFVNPNNPLAHEKTTAQEIWRDTDGQVDIFVAGVGTGGTVSGVGRALKSRNPSVKIIAVEPAASPLLSKGNAGPHKIQGIGANFIPKNYHPEYIDEVIAVADDDAIRTSRELSKTEGLLVGISSGASVYASRLLAQRPENKGKRIVAILPDTGERYLSTCEFDFENYPL